MKGLKYRWVRRFVIYIINCENVNLCSREEIICKWFLGMILYFGSKDRKEDMNEKIICKIISDCNFIRSSRAILKYSSASGNSRSAYCKYHWFNKRTTWGDSTRWAYSCKRRRTYFISLCVRQKRMSISASITRNWYRFSSNDDGCWNRSINRCCILLSNKQKW